MQAHNQSSNISRMPMTPYFTIAAGLLIAVLSFGLDILWHDVSGIAGHDEAVITTSNPGHLLVAFGGAVVLAATASGLWRTSRFLAIAATVVIAPAAASFAVYGSLVVSHEDGGQSGQHSQHDRGALHSHHAEPEGAK